jgi:putative SOS response-associated peptidase YedK
MSLSPGSTPGWSIMRGSWGEVEDGDLKELKPFPSDRMKMWPISPRVNSPKNDDPDILTPIEA